MPGKLSTHALDLYQGRPAAGLAVSLFALDAKGQRISLASTATNADGRTDAPLLGPGEIAAGTYEIVFGVGDYFARAGVPLPTPPFLGEVPVRFAIADASAAYHVPLLFSPWAYSTYRGS
ncbi:MAG: hydroxyisourate hydrolase [Verrucomicrobiota bacterium]